MKDLDFQIETMRKIRKTFLAVVDRHSLEQLNHIPKGCSNNIVWNYGHILVSQQGLCNRLAGRKSLLPDSITQAYKNKSIPTGNTTQAELDYLKEMSVTTLDALQTDYKADKFEQYNSYTVSFGVMLNSIEDAIRFNSAHEGLHLGYAMVLSRLVG